MGKEGDQIKKEQQKIDKFDDKVDKKVALDGKEYADIVIKKVDDVVGKIDANFGIKEQAVIDSPKFKEVRNRALSDTFKILQEIDKKNIGELTVKLETKLNDILKEFTPFTEEEKKITKFKSDLTEFNTYMEKRREYEKNGKFSDAEKLTKEYQAKHIPATEQASPLESANFQAEKKYQEVKNTLGDAEKIAEILKIAQGYIDQANQERKFEQQEGFRVGFILQGPNISGNGDAVNLPGELIKTTDSGEESPIADLASIVEIDPTKGVRIVMLPQSMEGTKETLKQFGVTEGWVKPDVLRKAISAIKMKFSHCEEGMTRCVTPKIEGKSLETAAKAQDLVEESNAIKAKMELMKLMEQTTITSERAIKSLWFSIECKNGKPSFSPKFLADFDNEVLANKKSGIRVAQESLLKATIIEATEKADPLSKEFYLGQEALSNGKLPEARFRLTKFLYESSVKKDQPEFKEMIEFAEEKVKVFNIASIKRLQKINDQLSDSKRYQSLLKDPANERFLYKFTQQNKANLEAQLQQSEAGTIDTKSQYQALIQRREQTISATPISSVAAYGGIERGVDKDNSDQLRDAWNSLVYAEFSTGVESDSSKIQDEYLSAARTLRELGQTDISSEYFEAAMKDDIEQVRGTISEAQKEQMRAKIIEENEKKRPDYEAKIRQKMFSKIDEFNAKRPAELQKPLEISAADLKALVDEAMAEGVEEQIKKVVMHGMEIANNKGLLEKGSKKAWGEYESMMDVNDKWYIISDKGAEKIAEQVFINGVIMALSGGVGALASASVRAFMIANGVRSGFALGAAGFVSESVGFELANRTIHSTILGEKGLFMPADLAKGIGQSMLMFGAIGGGNKLWGAVSEASGLVSKEALATAGTAERLLRQGANYTGQLATESAVFTATSDNSFIESAGDILMLRVGGKLVSPITGAMHETSQKIIEKGLEIVKEQEKEAVVSKEVTPEISTVEEPSTIDPDLQKKFDRRQETRQPEIQRIKEYWEEITEHSNITNSKDTETPEAHKAQSEMISFLREEINLGMPPNLDAMWEQVRKTPLTPEQRSMTLATIQHMLRTKNQTEMIMDEMEITALRRLGVAPGERPQRGDTKPLEDMRKQVFMEKLAEKMHLAPFKGNIDYKEIDGVLVLRCENNEDFARIANIHPGHTPAGVAITPAENGLGISLIVIRSDQELNENRSGVIRHELQHIFKQGSNNIEEGRLNYNNYSSTFQNGRSYFDEHGNLSKERVQEYLNVEKEDMHVSFKDEALAFLRTSHHQGLENMINGLHFSENNSYDYFNGMREVILKNITKARPELMGDAEFIKGLNATIDKYRAEYRAETKEWLDGIESAVRALQDSGMAEMQARDHLADLLMFVQLKEWGKKLSEIGGKVKIENDVHSEFLNNIKIKNRWPYNEPSSGHDFETEVGAPFRAKIEELESLREKAKDLPQSYRNKVDAYVDERIKAIKGVVQMADSKRVIDGTLKLRPVSVDSFVTLNRNVSALRDKTSKLPIKIREYLEKELALSEKSILSKTEVNKDPDLVWLENDGLLIDRAVSDPALFSYALDRIGDYRVNIKLLDLLGKHKMNSGDVASTINDAEQR
nr:hypothetical protein [Candidatus Gracilibacteria bacterium]